MWLTFGGAAHRGRGDSGWFTVQLATLLLPPQSANQQAEMVQLCVFHPP